MKASQRQSAISRLRHRFGRCVLLGATLVLLAATPAAASGPPQIESTYALQVAATSATLGAILNPDGEATTYSFQYVTQESFEHTGFSEPFSTSEGSLGSGTEPVTVTAHLSGLAPHTSYRYRLLATNAASPPGGTAGPPGAIATQALAAPFALPDQRAWELVSPPEKHGGAIKVHEGVADIQAAAAGEGVSYVASSPITETAQQGGTGENPVLSSRTAAGWSSREFMPSNSMPEGEGSEAEGLGVAEGVTSVGLLSSDLAQALIEPSQYVKPLSPQATERTLYLHNTQTGSYLPLVTPANAPQGAVFGAPCLGMNFLNATPDLTNVVFHSVEALTPEAHVNTSFNCGTIDTPPVNLYEWAAGQLKDVGILPNGEPTAFAGLGQEEEHSDFRVQHSISNDGRWIVWSSNGGSSLKPILYLRDMTKPASVQLGRRGAEFEGMTPDGSRVFFLETGELHSFNPATSADTIATAHMAPVGTRAEVQAVIGASEDGRAVYLVAKAVLGGTQENAAHERPVSGQPNLYLLRESRGAWTPTYVATLSPADEHSWLGRGNGLGNAVQPQHMTSHLSPDGRWLAFMSERPLTGYDNVDAVSGARDEEVFLYDGASGNLICASCDPSGARPHGLFDVNSNTNGPLVDPGNAWGGRWLAGSMPGWRESANRISPYLYQPRELGDSGRLFFQSAGALVPQDTNGTEDVYEYEPVGVGSCTEQSPTFNSASGGCVSLISSGTSAEESVFYDASESGKDVFFATSSQLAPQDVDREVDVYDARSPHVPGEPVGFPLPLKEPPCEGDACQPPTEAPNDQTPGSLTYHGPGNEHPLNHKHHGKHHRKKHHRRSHKRAARANRGGHNGA